MARPAMSKFSHHPITIAICEQLFPGLEFESVNALYSQEVRIPGIKHVLVILCYRLKFRFFGSGYDRYFIVLPSISLQIIASCYNLESVLYLEGLQTCVSTSQLTYAGYREKS